MKVNVQRELPFDAAESQTPSMRGNSMRENRETHGVPPPDGDGGRSGKAMPKPDMHVPRESDGVIRSVEAGEQRGGRRARRGGVCGGKDAN